eukprot:Gb_29440 [translate_table: standard]
MKKVSNLRRICHAASGIQPWYMGTIHARGSCTASFLGASSREPEPDFHHWFHYLCRFLFANPGRLRGSETSTSAVITSLPCIFGSIIATTVGVGLVTASASSEIAFAEHNNNQNNGSCNEDAKSSSTEKNVDIEKIVRQERERVEERLKKSDLQGGILPSFTVAAKGQQVAIRFQVPPSCDISHLIIDLISHLGLKTDESGGGSEMILRAWDSAVARQLILVHPDQYAAKGSGTDQRLERLKEEPLKHRTNDGNNICVLVFEPLIGSNNAEIEFLKRGSFTVKELDALVSALRIAGGNANAQRAVQKKHRESSKQRDRQNTGPNISSDAKALEALEAMGVKIYGLGVANGSSDKDVVSWDNIAGYHDQKREIEDTVLLALRRPEIYDNIAKGTRCKFESNRPRAVLFEGPPGTGKTSCARVIASQAGVPLLYVPLEIVMSKYYGESERLLGSVFTLANELPNGAIIFLDEVDSFAAARDKEMHEATRRILSVLLRQIDGFEQEKRVVVIAATNRRQDLDPALISRFDSLIAFNLPDKQTREEITAQYARHLSTQELANFAAVTDGMSGRDLRDICQQAERHWASKLIRGQVGDPSTHGLPPIQEYMECAQKRQETVLKWRDEEHSFMGDNQHIGSQIKKWPSVVV